MPTDLETSAVTTVDSATTQVVTPTAPAFDAADQKTWSSAQRENWNKTGDQPTKADSATATKKDETDTAAPDSAPDKTKSADSASDSATDPTQKPHLKTKTDTEKRFQELTDRLKKAEERADAAEREKAAAPRDTKQVSQPAAEVYKPLDEKEYFKANPKATYEDFVRAAGRDEGKWAARQEIAVDNQRRAQAEAAKELSSKIEEAKTRYPDYDQARITHAVGLMMDKAIPLPVQATLNASPVFVDLMYVLSEPKALADFVQTAKTDPVAALRKIVLTEQLVQAELAKGKTSPGDKGKDAATRERDGEGKFVSTEDKATDPPKPRAPKPPSEVGGRGTAPEDALRTAAEKNDFRSFEAEQNRRMKARQA